MSALKRAVLLAAAALTGAAAGGAAQTRDALRFCLADHNLPMSVARPPSGIDVEVARRLASAMNADAELTWLDEHDRGDEAVLRRRCDLAFGAVVDPGLADGRVLPGLALTAPSHAAGYQLIRRADVPPVRTLDELGEARIGVESESVAIYTLKQRGHSVYAMHDYDAVIDAVANGSIDYGYLWGPLAAHLLRDRHDVVLIREFQPEDRWNFALLGRSGDRALRDRVDAALRRLVRDGEIAKIFERYAVPYLAPAASARPDDRLNTSDETANR